MRPIVFLLIYFLALLTSAAFAQGNSYFNCEPSVTYKVNPDDRQVFIDSLFSNLRKNGLRQLSGIGERTTMRKLTQKDYSFQYGVRVTYTLNSVIVWFYAYGEENHLKDYTPMILKDYYANVDPRAPRPDPEQQQKP